MPYENYEIKMYCRYCGKEAEHKLPSGEYCCTEKFWNCPSWGNNFKKQSKIKIKEWKPRKAFKISEQEKVKCGEEISNFLKDSRIIYKGLKSYYLFKTNEGRLSIILHFTDNTNLRRSYPKFLMEIYLDKYLEKDDTVHHIDNDFLNNNINNLKIIKKSEHIRRDVVRNKPQKFICPECQIEFILENKKLRNADINRKKGKAGPFCSRSCAGKYCQKVQMGMKPLSVKLIKLEKFRLSDEEKS